MTDKPKDPCCGLEINIDPENVEEVYMGDDMVQEIKLGDE